MNDILLSIIVGTTEPKFFGEFYTSLDRNKIPFQLIIGDASKKDYVDHCSKSHPIDNLKELIILKEDPPLGHVKGFNQCFKKATSKWVCWLNDDVEVLPDWDTVAIDFMEKNPNVIGAMFFFDRSYHATTPVVATYHGLIYANFGIVSREIGNEIGWFDERIGMYGADVAFSILGAKMGHPTKPIYFSRIKHHRPYMHENPSNVLFREPDRIAFAQTYIPLYNDLPMDIKSFPWIIVEEQKVIPQRCRR